MIDFENDLNSAQLEAATHPGGPILVIAGAGSGKTRTLVYRLAYLCQQGVRPENILLLTFTRKASAEMLGRAEELIGRDLRAASSGTFHSFAFQALRRHGHMLGFESFTILDRADSEDVVKSVKEELRLGKGERAYPKKATLMNLISKSRNKERSLGEIIEDEAFHLAHYTDDVAAISHSYKDYKKRHGLVDYDDLLFLFEEMLRSDEGVKRLYRERFRHVMVDEYQDTNLVQARLVRLLAGRGGNVMAVGDDAQSIYAFRGANVDNILNFPNIFENTKLIRLERNYRSTQPILTLTNEILKGAVRSFEKKLYTERLDGKNPQVVHTVSDTTQATLVVSKALELGKKYPLHEVAVLFRAGYQSYPVEIALNKVGVKYRKFGGLKFHEAAHIKDVLAYIRAATNPTDILSWKRVLGHIKGVGPKTATRIVQAVLEQDQKYLKKAKKRFAELDETLEVVAALHSGRPAPAPAIERIMAHYAPILIATYPDDHPRRQAGLEQLAQVASVYDDLDDFLGDLSLENPEADEDLQEMGALTLSTVHSAKGLEYKAVLLIDMVEDRFPSKRAQAKPESMDEERRLLYVACTRAKDDLFIFVPGALYNRYNHTTEQATTSPFISELPPSTFDAFTETFSGTLAPKGQAAPRTGIMTKPAPAKEGATRLKGACKHKIFGTGRIVAALDGNKYRVNFPGFGLKVIIGDYLEIIGD